MPAILCLVGVSGSGKTELASRLIGELNGRGLRVAAIKHGAHGFDMLGPMKDGGRLCAAGADQALVVGPGGVLSTAPGPEELALEALLRSTLPGRDVVLIEGCKDSLWPKVLVTRAGVPEAVPGVAGRVIATVGDGPRAAFDAPVFAPDEVVALADLVLREATLAEAPLELVIDGRHIDLSPFVQSTLEGVVLGFLAT